MEDKSTLLDPSLDKQLKGHRSGITALYFSPNEQQLASSSLDNSILLWDLSVALRSYRFRGHDEAVTDVTFSPSGKFMASASRDKTVRLWVPTVTGSTGVFKAHSQTVRSVQFSPDGTKLITASDDKIVKMWSSSNQKFISSFVGHTNWVRCARMSSDGSIIASCSDDKSTRLWDAASGQLIHVYKDQKGHGVHLAWHPSGCYIAVGTSQGNIKLYDTRTQSLVQYYSIHNDAVSQVAFHPSGSYILTASKDGKMKLLDLLEGHPIFTLSGHSGAVSAVAFSPAGDRFASAGEDKMVNLWTTNFTELANEVKGNGVDPPRTARGAPPAAAPRTHAGARQWYLCYHSNKYPVASYVQLDDHQDLHSAVEQNHDDLGTIDELEQQAVDRTLNSHCHRHRSLNNTARGLSRRDRESSVDSECSLECPSHSNSVQHQSSPRESSGSNTLPNTVRRERSPDSNAEKTLHSTSHVSHTPRIINWRSILQLGRRSTPKPDCDLECTFSDNYENSNRVHTPHCNRSAPSNANYTRISLDQIPGCSENVGHSSHIPRSFHPKPSTYTIPSCDRTIGCQADDSNLYGFVKLTEKDVCYTSGTIEWVGRKRTYPVNNGFKTLNDVNCNEHINKKSKRLDNSMSSKGLDGIRECECVEMLPTVNAIVDHLNALHEAVDLIDLRLNTVEDSIGNN